ncbi:DUF2493 domain-containing protein [Desulforegula conservatrix]|uniref:DUF2493 domain-containing protein n=1 Tax=Desulforegula conservatrix TaxID=153026 RepID=UPI00041110A9|nr:DUF2493 domain-containing protein [Desulforegula conservatrix]
MRTIIAGSRICNNMANLLSALKSAGWKPTTVVCGTAKGVDTLGEKWAIDNGIPIEKFAPDWSRYGRAAGPKRNLEMAKSANALIALWDGKSKGTKNMIETARKEGLKVYVHLID